jgi:hypothetical protein
VGKGVQAAAHAAAQISHVAGKAMGHSPSAKGAHLPLGLGGLAHNVQGAVGHLTPTIKAAGAAIHSGQDAFHGVMDTAHQAAGVMHQAQATGNAIGGAINAVEHKGLLHSGKELGNAAHQVGALGSAAVATVKTGIAAAHEVQTFAHDVHRAGVELGKAVPAAGHLGQRINNVAHGVMSHLPTQGIGKLVNTVQHSNLTKTATNLFHAGQAVGGAVHAGITVANDLRSTIGGVGQTIHDTQRAVGAVGSAFHAVQQHGIAGAMPQLGNAARQIGHAGIDGINAAHNAVQTVRDVGAFAHQAQEAGKAIGHALPGVAKAATGIANNVMHSPIGGVINRGNALLHNPAVEKAGSVLKGAGEVADKIFGVVGDVQQIAHAATHGVADTQAAVNAWKHNASADVKVATTAHAVADWTGAAAGGMDLAAKGLAATGIGAPVGAALEGASKVLTGVSMASEFVGDNAHTVVKVAETVGHDVQSAEKEVGHIAGDIGHVLSSW